MATVAAADALIAAVVHPEGYDGIARGPGDAGGERDDQMGSSGVVVRGTGRVEGADHDGDADHGDHAAAAAAAYDAAAGPRGSKSPGKSAWVVDRQDGASPGWERVASRVRACGNVHALCADSSYPGEGTREKASESDPFH